MIGPLFKARFGCLPVLDCAWVPLHYRQTACLLSSSVVVKSHPTLLITFLAPLIRPISVAYGLYVILKLLSIVLPYSDGDGCNRNDKDEPGRMYNGCVISSSSWQNSSDIFASLILMSCRSLTASAAAAAAVAHCRQCQNITPLEIPRWSISSGWLTEDSSISAHIIAT